MTPVLDGATFSDVGSETVAPSIDRRSRKRESRRLHLLDLAADLVDERGIEGLTMAALAERADYAPASLYTYFPSRSAVVASLQTRALQTLGEVAAAAVSDCDRRLASTSLSDRIGALVHLWAFGELFLAAPDEHPREFALQQRLLVTDAGQDTSDVATVVPAAMAVLDVPRRLLAAAATVGALDGAGDRLDPLGQRADGDLVRTISWLVALNGALLTDGLVMGMPTTGAALGRELTSSLLRGWGADLDELAVARRTVLDFGSSQDGSGSDGESSES